MATPAKVFPIPSLEPQPAFDRSSDLRDLRFRALLPREAWATLPQAVRERFSKRLGLGDTALYVGRGIGMALDVSVEAGTLVFRSRHFFLELGRRRLILPGWLGPGRVRVAHEDLGGGWFRFVLDVARPRLRLFIRQVAVYEDRVPIRHGADEAS